MVTPAQLRSLSLSLPDTEEKSHFGKPDFRVRNKIFAGLTEEPRRGYFKARPELQAELSAATSGVFAAAPGGWGRSGWTYVELPSVELAVLRELIIDAWKLVAPAKLVAVYESGSASEPVARGAAAARGAVAAPRVARESGRGRARKRSSSPR
jgi:hypothetical protein